MADDLDPAEAAAPSILFLPDMPEISEIFAQTSADDHTHADADGVELDEDHFENFGYEIESDSESDFDHELRDADGEPLVDDSGD